jgi:Zn-dependent peptidase ImmA (M78 family)
LIVATSVCDGILVIYQDLPSRVRGFTCLGSDYEPCIVINASMTREQQRKTFLHEMDHIKKGELYDPDYTEY